MLSSKSLPKLSPVGLHARPFHGILKDYVVKIVSSKAAVQVINSIFNTTSYLVTIEGCTKWEQVTKLS